MKIMVLDNYDSFTYNLVHILNNLNRGRVDVYRNNEVTIETIEKYDKIVVSPGPGVPDQAGITKRMIAQMASKKSILGVCLGCQAIAEVFGGRLINLDRVYHGVATEIFVSDPEENIFRGINSVFTAGRYHSWAVDENNLPEGLRITARDEKGMIMALSHVTHDIKGVQFHPESVLTDCGKQILHNWLTD
jgi:anthranilate synthase component 2